MMASATYTFSLSYYIIFYC